MPSTPLPVEPVRIGLDACWPESCLPAIQAGYESKSQDEKWSFYFNDPWLEIWRPNRDGVFVYAVKIQHSGEDIRVAEAWVAKDFQEYCSPNPTAAILNDALVLLTKQDPIRRTTGHGPVQITTREGVLHFTGAVSSQAQLIEVVRALQAQLRELTSRGR